MRIKLSRNRLLMIAILAGLIILAITGVVLTRPPSASATKASAKDGKVMVRVPAGEFRMGTSAEQLAWLKSQSDLQLGNVESEMPQISVTLPEFYIDQNVVTNAEYKKFIDANPNHAVPFLDNALVGGFNWDKAKRTPPLGQELDPVVLVTWYDAMAYCQWAGKRLPTEAEWEKAARGTDGRLWTWGDEPDASKLKPAESSGDSLPTPSVSSTASPYGAMNMVKFVWQWTSSLDKPYPYNANDGRENANASGMRIVRGGTRLLSLGATRTASRNGADPGNVSLSIGFRCVQ